MRFLNLTVWIALTACGPDKSTDTSAMTGPDAIGFTGEAGGLESSDFSVTDEFTFHVSPVDVLFVVDDSCSMDEEQVALQVGFSGFFNLLKIVGDQYHIGVVSTDMDDPAKSGQLRDFEGTRFITGETKDPYTAFDDMITGLGIKGSGTEKGVFATQAALDYHRDGYNAGFYREEAALLVVVMSDEPDQSTADLTYPEFLDWFNSLKPKSEPGFLTFNSIVGPPGGCSSATGLADEGTGYLDLSGMTGGVIHSICDTGFGAPLETMVAQVPTEEFFLSEEPVLDSITLAAVEPDGTYVYMTEDDWVYDAKVISIQLRRAVADLSIIEIRYLPRDLITE